MQSNSHPKLEIISIVICNYKKHINSVFILKTPIYKKQSSLTSMDIIEGQTYIRVSASKLVTKITDIYSNLQLARDNSSHLSIRDIKIVMLVNWGKPSVYIGVLKTACIGVQMLLSMKTLAVFVLITLHKTCQRVRRIALNALNLEESFKRSNRQKSNRAAMDNNYMLTILTACLYHHNDVSKPICQQDLRCAYPGQSCTSPKLYLY